MTRLFREPIVRLRYASGFPFGEQVSHVIVAGLLDANVPCVCEDGAFIVPWRHEDTLRLHLRTISTAMDGIEREVVADAQPDCN